MDEQMTPRAEAEKAITALLAQHRFRRHTGVQQRDGSVRKQPQGCECWRWEGDETSHRAHVASVLADLMADGPTLADAWDETTVPAPHAEAAGRPDVLAEVEAAWKASIWAGDGRYYRAFRDGWMRGRGDRG